MAGRKNEGIELMDNHVDQKNKCKFYESCSAPLCPVLSDEQNSNYIWYPDEEICQRKRGNPDWVKQQQKVAIKVKPENNCYYFTLDMLKVRFRVTSNVKGLDPNIDLEKERLQLKVWHKKHKGTKKRRTSNALKNKRRQALVLARKAKKQTTIGLINKQV